VPIDELNRAVTALIPHDNAWTIRARRPTFIVNADALHGLGLIEAVERATFRLAAPGGATHELELEALPAPEYRRRLGTGEYLPRRRMPSYVRRRDEARWVEPVGAGRALHVAYNVTRGETATFASEVEALAEPRRVELIVLDLRHNGGGDNRAYGPLLDALERLARERGKRLAVLTSRATFSAAMQLIVDVEQRMPALFVGEPTGGSPNQYGDAAAVSLPASGLTAHVATIAWMTAGPSDQRVTREPDVAAPLDSSAFFGGDDPVLATALGCLA
jgi:hypothetical protein